MLAAECGIALLVGILLYKKGCNKFVTAAIESLLIVNSNALAEVWSECCVHCTWR